MEEKKLDFGINIKCALVISGEIGYNQGVHPRQHAPLQLALTVEVAHKERHREERVPIRGGV